MSPDGAPASERLPEGLPLTLALDTVLRRALAAQGGRAEAAQGLAALLTQTLAAPGPQDRGFVAGALRLALSPPDLLILYALLRCEQDATVAQSIAGLQTGEARFRPAAGLLEALGRRVAAEAGAPFSIWQSRLWSLGVIHAAPGAAPAVLSPVLLTGPMAAALGLPSDVRLDPANPPPHRIPPSWMAAADTLAARLPRGPVTLALRGPLPGDLMLYAAALARAFGRPAVDMPSPEARATGLSAALNWIQALPVERVSIPAGTRVPLPPLTGFDGPRVVLLDAAGGLDGQGQEVWEIGVPPLTGADRAALWPHGARVPDALAAQGPDRLAAIAQRLAQQGKAPERAVLRAAAGIEARPDLEPHGQLVSAVVTDAALVASAGLKRDLDLLAARCATRRDPCDRLGPAFRARGVETGVRALLCGPSGGGKTMACAWLATRLGLPLFRVDLSSVVSKYIGETEENLARILDRAEAADVILLFDEADSLFGARTEVKDSSDRFANNQTNFLLSRIESYNGIVLMTTNGRERIDSAFARRIDQMIEVPIPDAKDRRAIWQAHLGDANGLSGLELNSLARGADISGGHIRSVTATAAVLARQGAADAPRITMAEIGPALALEYRKIGRTPPSGLVRG